MKKVLVLGASGLIGSAICDQVSKSYDVLAPTSSKLDLLNRDSVVSFFHRNKPEKVILAAAMKAGVGEFSKYPVEFLNRNLTIQLNVIESCFETNVSRFVFLGASSIYPSRIDAIISEDDFQTGWVQKGTEPYSLAKAVGTKMCEYYNQEYGTSYVVACLSNVYGWSDKHYDRTSVIPAFIDRFQQAVREKKDSVTIWGTGENKREFLYSKDCASAIHVLLDSDVKGLINVGSGEVISVNELAQSVAKVTGFNGKIEHDLTKPNGSQRSALDISKLKALGWTPKYSLEDGLKETIVLKDATGK